MIETLIEEVFFLCWKCLSNWWLYVTLAVILPMLFSQWQSFRACKGPPVPRRFTWSPENGLHVVMRHGFGVKKIYKASRIHTIKGPFGFSCFVPKDFEFDGPSIPVFLRPLIWVLDPWGRYKRGAMAHDLFYGLQISSRFQSDAVYYDIMTEDKTPLFARKAIFYGVRLFGGAAWDKAGIELQKKNEAIMDEQ